MIEYIEAVLVMWLAASLAFALWLRRRDQIAAFVRLTEASS